MGTFINVEGVRGVVVATGNSEALVSTIVGNDVEVSTVPTITVRVGQSEGDRHGGTVTVAALHDDVGAVRGRGGHAVARGLAVVYFIIVIVVAHASEARVVGLPAHGALPAAIESLANDEHIAVAVPSEAAFVEHELVPTRGGKDVVARVDEGHAGGDVRGAGQGLIAHIGHPDADVVLGRGAGS